MRRIRRFMLLAVATAALAVPGSAWAATFTVNDLDDVRDSEYPGPFTDGICDAAGADGCTLRAAIDEANASAVGSDTIDVSVPGAINLTLGQLIISEPTILNGNAAGTTLDGGGADRVLSAGGSSVTLNDLTLEDGAIADSSGAGIFTTATLLTLNRVTVTGNTVTSSIGGIGGAGINVQTDSNSLVLNDSTVSGNTITGLSGLGAGIRTPGPLVLDGTTIANNSATTASAGRGGGIDANPGGTSPLTIVNSTFSGNSSGSSGGGGFFATGNVTPVTIAGSTFANNTTTGAGGAFRSFGPTRTSQGSIYVSNTAAANDNCGDSFNGTPANNIDGGADCGFGTSNGNQENVSAGALDLGPLADNGGPTPTRSIGLDSVALDAATGCSGLGEDQRGVSRPQGSACDIGAFEVEYQPLTAAVTGTGTGVVTATGINCPGDCSESVPEGTLVSFGAAPTGGSSFSGWTGACSGTAACEVTVDGPESVTAGFAAAAATPPKKKCKKGRKLKKGKCVKKKRKKR